MPKSTKPPAELHQSLPLRDARPTKDPRPNLRTSFVQVVVEMAKTSEPWTASDISLAVQERCKRTPHKGSLISLLKRGVDLGYLELGPVAGRTRSWRGVATGATAEEIHAALNRAFKKAR